MVIEAQAKPRMSGTQFRAFQQTRPDPERWELIDGVPAMMMPPTLSHQLISDNLTRVLNEALRVHNPARRAVSRAGIELGDTMFGPSGGQYRPEPDVMVIDINFATRQRFVDRAYLIAEIVSDTDHEPVPGAKEPWIAVKRRLYLAHETCEAVLLIDPCRIATSLDVGGAGGWEVTELTRLNELLAVPSCGLRCRLADLYDGTPLNREAASPLGQGNMH